MEHIYFPAFQSTHPSRGATTDGKNYTIDQWFQSTHPSRGATKVDPKTPGILLFQSTHPSRGATRTADSEMPPGGVSIHAPLAGCDFRRPRRSGGRWCFNPRTPRGVRRFISVLVIFCWRFQSTHPSRGATANGPTKGTFCHVFMGVTRHKYDFSRRFVPRPSFGTVLPPIFYHAIFCSLHLRAHKEPLR